MGKKDVTVVESNEVMVAPDLGEWGDEGVSSKDIVLPRLWLMQALSQYVEEGKAQAGDMVNSLTGDVIAKSGSAVQFVPFKHEKFWFSYSLASGKPELIGVEPVTSTNVNRVTEQELNGVKIQHQYAIRVYGLVEGEALPVAVTFKSTSLRAGKQLLTEIYVKNKMAGKSPAARYMELGAKKEKNDKGVFYVFTCKSGGDVPVALQQDALNWYKTLDNSSFQVAGEEEIVTDTVSNESSY